MKPYKSPMVEARAIHAGQVPNASHKLRALARRMVELPPTVIVDLESAKAPKCVFRWVTGGSNATKQRQRADLVLHLRKAIERPLEGWLEERHLSAAWRVVMEEWASARARGGLARPLREIPLDLYRAAIDGATKGTRTSWMDEALELDPEPEVSDDEDDEESDDEGDDPDEDEQDGDAEESGDEGGEDEDQEAPPSSGPMVSGRPAINAWVGKALREALRIDDNDAAQILTAALRLLLGERKVG